MALPSALRLAVDYVRHAAQAGVAVETAVWPGTPTRLPLLIVSASAPVAVSNDAAERSSRFTLHVACYAEGAVTALDLAEELFASLHRQWRSAYTTPYGWISLIDRDSLQPVMASNDLEADDAVRFDIALNVIARRA